MPLTPDRKRKALIGQGYNPDEYDIDDATYEIIPRNKQQPSSADTNALQPIAKQAPGVGGTMWNEALNATIPTIAGGGGAALGMHLAPAGPYGIGKIAGAGIGSLALGGVAAILQEPFQSESFKQELAAGREENPVASTVGMLAPFLATLGGVRPDWKTLSKDLPSAIGKIGRSAVTRAPLGKTLSEAEKLALAQSGIGAAANVGINMAVRGVSEGRLPTLEELALDTILGAGYTHTTKFGQKALRLPANPIAKTFQEQVIDEYGALRQSANEEAALATEAQKQQAAKRFGTDLEDLTARAAETKLNPDVLDPAVEGTAKVYRAAAIEGQHTPDPVAEEQRIAAEKKQAEYEVRRAEILAKRDALKLARQREIELEQQQALDAAIKAAEEESRLLAEKAAAENPARIAKPTADYLGEQTPIAKRETISGESLPQESKPYSLIKHLADLAGEPPAVSETPTKPVKPLKFSAPSEQPKPRLESDIVAEGGKAAPARRFATADQTGQESATPLGRAIASHTKASTDTRGQSHFTRAVQNVLTRRAKQLGVSVEEVAEIIVKGERKAGMVDPAAKDLVITLSRSDSGLDTIPHELWHIFHEDMKNGKSAIGRSIAQRAEKAFGGEEPLTKETGLEFTRRNFAEDGYWNEYWKDFKAFFKDKWGNASKDDYVRITHELLSNRAKPFREVSAEVNVAPVPGALELAKASEKSEQKVGQKSPLESYYGKSTEEMLKEDLHEGRFGIYHNGDYFDNKREHNIVVVALDAISKGIKASDVIVAAKKYLANLTKDVLQDFERRDERGNITIGSERVKVPVETPIANEFFNRLEKLSNPTLRDAMNVGREMGFSYHGRTDITLPQDYNRSLRDATVKYSEKSEQQPLMSGDEPDAPIHNLPGAGKSYAPQGAKKQPYTGGNKYVPVGERSREMFRQMKEAVNPTELKQDEFKFSGKSEQKSGFHPKLQAELAELRRRNPEKYEQLANRHMSLSKDIFGYAPSNSRREVEADYIVPFSLRGQNMSRPERMTTVAELETYLDNMEYAKFGENGQPKSLAFSNISEQQPLRGEKLEKAFLDWAVENNVSKASKLYQKLGLTQRNYSHRLNGQEYEVMNSEYNPDGSTPNQPEYITKQGKPMTPAEIWQEVMMEGKHRNIRWTKKDEDAAPFEFASKEEKPASYIVQQKALDKIVERLIQKPWLPDYVSDPKSPGYNKQLAEDLKNETKSAVVQGLHNRGLDTRPGYGKYVSDMDDVNFGISAWRAANAHLSLWAKRQSAEGKIKVAGDMEVGEEGSATLLEQMAAPKTKTGIDTIGDAIDVLNIAQEHLDSPLLEKYIGRLEKMDWNQPAPDLIDRLIGAIENKDLSGMQKLLGAGEPNIDTMKRAGSNTGKKYSEKSEQPTDEQILNRFAQLNYDKNFSEIPIIKQDVLRDGLEKYRDKWTQKFNELKKRRESRRASNPEADAIFEELADVWMNKFIYTHPFSKGFGDLKLGLIPGAKGDAWWAFKKFLKFVEEQPTGKDEHTAMGLLRRELDLTYDEALPLVKRVMDFKLANANKNYRYSPESEQRLFVTQSEKQFLTPKPFGLQLNSKGQIDQLQFRAKLSQIPEMERELLENSGFLEHIKGQTHFDVKAAAEWLEKNGPQVKVESYGMEGKVSDAKREYDKMTHEWYEQGMMYQGIDKALGRGLNTLPEIQKFIHDNYNHSWKVKQDDIDKTVRYASLREQTQKEPRDTSPRARWAGIVSSKSAEFLKAHGYHEGAVVIPSKAIHTGQHKPFPPNTIGHWRGYYMAGKEIKAEYPDGKYNHIPDNAKVMVVEEAQSDWGQERRDAEKLESLSAEEKRERGLSLWKADKEVPNHPLLKDYNRLILKAAIEQARKEGATHIVVSDEPTVAYTEGWDKGHLIKEMPTREAAIAEMDRLATKYQKSARFNTAFETRNIDGKEYVVLVADRAEISRSELYNEEGFKYPQRDGAKLNYDIILPKIASELTGSAGERVSLGEHKNAFSAYGDRYVMTKKGKPDILIIHDGSDATTQRINNLISTDGYKMNRQKEPRSNLIFKNPDGTPKTDISGMMYPIEKVAARREAGEPFSMSGKKYSEKSEQPLGNPAKQADITRRFNQAIQDMRSRGYAPANIVTEANGYIVNYSNHSNEWNTGPGARRNKGEELKLGVNQMFIPGKLDEVFFIAENLPSHDMLLNAASRQVVDKFIGEPAEGYKDELPNVTKETSAFLDKVSEPQLKYTDREKLWEVERELERYKTYQKDTVDRGSFDSAERYKEPIKKLQDRIERIKSKARKFSDASEQPLDQRTSFNEARIGSKTMLPEKDRQFSVPVPGIIAEGSIPQPIVSLSDDFSSTVKYRPQWAIDQEKNRQKYSSASETPATLHESFKESAERLANSSNRRNILAELSGGKLPGIGSEISKLETRQGDSGKYVAPRLKEAFVRAKEYYGRYFGKISNKLDGYSDTEIESVRDVMLAEVKAKKSFEADLVNDKARELYQSTRAALEKIGQERIDANQPVWTIDKNGKYVARKGGKDPYYTPQVVGRDQITTLLDYRDSEQFTTLRNDFIKHQVDNNGLTEKGAEQVFDDIVSSYSGTTDIDQSHFNAISRAEGIGLPTSWIEQDFRKALQRYFSRASKARAWFDVIESDPEAMHIIGRQRDAWGEPVKRSEKYNKLAGETLTNVLNAFYGRAQKVNPRLDAVSRIASASVLGPLTAINDIVSVPFNIAKYAPWHPDVLTMDLFNVRKGMEEGLETGAIRRHISDMQELFNDNSEFVDKANTIANGITKWTGRDGLERVSRGLSQSMASVMVRVHKKLALEGNKKSIKLLDEISNSKDGWKKLGDKELASRLSSRVQGNYDVTGLPAWVLDSQLAPFFKLSKWNIEQTNNFYKYAILPAAKGEDYVPLMVSLFGIAAGGYIAKELREKLTGKKSAVPGLEEIAASSSENKIPAYAYNIMAAAAYSGQTGLLADAAKSVLDVAHKNKPQGFNYPLLEIVANVTEDTLGAANAILEGANVLDVAVEYSKNILRNNTQVGRLAVNWANGKETAEKNARRDLRTFRMLEGEDYPSQLGESATDYTNLDMKKFKRTEDLGEATELLGDLLSSALEKSKGDPYKLKKEFLRLKLNSYQTMPNMNDAPVDFYRYLAYLEKTQGIEAATERLQDYVKRNTINKVKSSLVP